ncbi:MAG: glucose-1-phosphate thymidylyltransferase [Chloroflexi bacterium]|nr:glucose-1-phosphate thymidylyltransferase [Chloroflexota bacterium]
MKALILAAGQGTRLRPVTLTMPKSLVPVANRWLINYALDALKKAGLTDIGIVVNSLESPIVTNLKDGSALGVKIEYIVQDEQLGLAHATSLCRDFVGGEPFTVFLGDNIFQDKMTGLLTAFASSDEEAAVVLGSVSDPTRFGIAEIDNGRILRVVEKPKDPPSNLAIAGVYLFRASIFDAIQRIKPSGRNELEITDAIQVLIDDGLPVASYRLSGWWIDAGKPDAIIMANQLVLEALPYTPAPEQSEQIEGESEVSHRVIIGRESRIIDSVIRGPVIIGNNAVIRNSYVGPYTSIGDNVTVEGSEIESSIVMKNCEIRNILGRIDRSLLAENARVTSATHMPDAHRFVLAENSYVQF